VKKKIKKLPKGKKQKEKEAPNYLFISEGGEKGMESLHHVPEGEKRREAVFTYSSLAQEKRKRRKEEKKSGDYIYLQPNRK